MKLEQIDSGKILMSVPVDGQNGKVLNQWKSLYSTLASDHIIILKGGLKHITPAGSGVIIFKDKTPYFILANYKDSAKDLEVKSVSNTLKGYGYKTFLPKHKFGGSLDMVYLYDNVFVGCFGENTSLEALNEIEKQFNLNIIKVKVLKPFKNLKQVLFNLDCENAMICKSAFSTTDLYKIWDHMEIKEISGASTKLGGCSLFLGTNSYCYFDSNLSYMTPTCVEYEGESKKVQEVTDILHYFGFNPIIVNLSALATSEKENIQLNEYILDLSYTNYR